MLPNASEILHAIADGKMIQEQQNGQWLDIAPAGVLYALSGYSSRIPINFRVKPNTITIGNMEVPRPESVPLVSGQIYYTIDIRSDELAEQCTWGNDQYDKRWFKSGLIHLTKDAAIEHCKALITISGGTYDPN